MAACCRSSCHRFSLPLPPVASTCLSKNASAPSRWDSQRRHCDLRYGEPHHIESDPSTLAPATERAASHTASTCRFPCRSKNAAALTVSCSSRAWPARPAHLALPMALRSGSPPPSPGSTLRCFLHLERFQLPFASHRTNAPCAQRESCSADRPRACHRLSRREGSYQPRHFREKGPSAMPSRLGASVLCLTASRSGAARNTWDLAEYSHYDHLSVHMCTVVRSHCARWL